MQVKTNIEQNIKRQRAFVFVISLFALFGFYSKAQFTMSLETEVVCPQSQALIAVNTTNFEDIEAVTMYIEMDKSKATFVSLDNVNSVLLGGVLMSNFIEGINSKIAITWTSLSPATLNAGKLFDLKLNYIKDSCTLTFASNCEFVQHPFTILPEPVYTHGLIMPEIDILEHPLSYKAEIGDDVSFELVDIGGISYQWQMKTSGWYNLFSSQTYSGVNSSILSVSNITYSLNEKYYRCIVSNNSGCSFPSDSAQLVIDSVTDIEELDRESDSDILCFPNPVENGIHLNSSLIEFDLIKIYDLYGKVVFERRYNSEKDLYIPLQKLGAGFYKLMIYNNGDLVNTSSFIKSKIR